MTSGATLRGLRRYEEAVIVAQEVLVPGRLATFGADHDDTLNAQELLAHCFRDDYRFEDAMRLMQDEVLPILTAKRGANHCQTLAAQHFVADRLNSLGRYGDALRLAEDIIFPGLRETVGSDHVEFLFVQDDTHGTGTKAHPLCPCYSRQNLLKT